MGERVQAGLLGIVLLATGLLAWQLQARPHLAVDVEDLERIPARLGSWRSVEIPLAPAVESALDADFNLQREFQSALGDRVWLYIGYYGTEAGGRPEHTPRFCYPAAGWGIAETRVVAVDADRKANEYVVERQGEERLVHFWYRSHRSASLLGGWDQNLDRLFGRLRTGRADGALVRLSTVIHSGDEAAARNRLISLGRALHGTLGAHWPEEGAPAESVSTAASAESSKGV